MKLYLFCPCTLEITCYNVCVNKYAVFSVIIFVVALGAIVFANQQQNQTNKNNQSLDNFPLVTTTPTPPQEITATLSPTQTSPIGPVEESTKSAVIKTSQGDITLILFTPIAPNTVKNFIDKAKSGFYNGLTFHRVEDWVIQGGDPLGNGTGGGNMPTELNNQPFVAGSLGVARADDIRISNDSQFFITKKDSEFLNQKYTNFGIVTGGMDVVNKIQIGDKILGISIE